MHLLAHDDVHFGLGVRKLRPTVRHTGNRMLRSEDLPCNLGTSLPCPFLKDLGFAPGEATWRAFGQHHKQLVGVERFDRDGDRVDFGLSMVRQYVVGPLCDCFCHQHSRPALAEATSLAFGHRKFVHYLHFPGVHRFGCCGDCVGTGLWLMRKHDVCPVSDWLQHEYHVLVTLHNVDRDGHDFRYHSLRHHLYIHDLGHGLLVQNFGHCFPVHKMGSGLEVQNLGNSQGPFLVVFEYWKGSQWLDLRDGF